MTIRPPWPPEISEAYGRGERIGWSVSRAAWVSYGLPRTSLAPKEMRGGRTVARAALEELAPRKAAQRREVPDHCPRCRGSVIPATDEDGDPDDHCIACGHRVRGLTPEQAEALRREMDALNEGKQRRREPTSGGIKL